MSASCGLVFKSNSEVVPQTKPSEWPEWRLLGCRLINWIESGIFSTEDTVPTFSKKSVSNFDWSKHVPDFHLALVHIKSTGVRENERHFYFL